MSVSLGLSIGVANLVAARADGTPMRRASVLRLFEHRAAEVGLPEENPGVTEPGLVLRGFVERVGDPAPLVAADGTRHQGEALTVEALNAMARTVGYGAPITVAAPAYWSEGQFAALRGALRSQPALAPDGVPAAVISDATASLAALHARPGCPTSGVVALCDFGAGGTSVTLADAGSNLRQIGPTVRYREFSGDEIDQLVLGHLLRVAPDVDGTEVSGTATSMGSVTRLLGGCRAAKEQLSALTTATIATGAGEAVRLSRNDFEQLIATPLDRFVGFVEEILQRNGFRVTLAAVATTGGGAAIPLVTTRLSERLQVPVFTTPQPSSSAAIGAGLLARHSRQRVPRPVPDPPSTQLLISSARSSPPRQRRRRGSIHPPPNRPTSRWPGPRTPTPATNRSPTPAPMPLVNTVAPQRLSTSSVTSRRLSKPNLCRGTSAPPWSSAWPQQVWRYWSRWCWG
ncbi:hypothetical protein NIIDMKKI_69450 [Mycobacterium kansasii]|uniref:Hsp70 family protein n=1 Tax=Mycobacterium kansasii TaxID=1768 RepID=A0A7G1IPE5_MYCKA|nr:hypothetical protein NIIDMKKI_69450 [Mycobacterium kansasii]